MTLQQVLQQWDGKSAATLEHAYQEYLADIKHVQPLITLLNDEQTSDGASWLLKKFIESKGEISTEQGDCLWLLCSTWQSWPTCLHVLQVFENLPISIDNQKLVEMFLRRCLVSDNKFVRAWSYHGLFHLQRQFPQYADEVKSFFNLAMSDEAASVKARIRNIVKKYKFKTD